MARELKTSSRGFKTEFEQSIQGDIVKALVELITNSDDSYTRAGRDGPIHVRFEGYESGCPLGTVRVAVVDQAEGMTEDQIEYALGEVGGATSGFSSRKSIRGLLGRGLKQAAFGIGVGVDLISIKDETISFGRLYEDERGRLMFSRGSEFARDFGMPDHKPRRATDKDRKIYGIRGNGTYVGLIVSKSKWTVHKQLGKVKEMLQRHYALRSILNNSKKRPIYLSWRGRKIGPLVHQQPDVSPKGPVLEKRGISVPGFEGAIFNLTIYRASIDLGPVNEYSDSGIVVYAERIPIANELFGYERHPNASRFFGELHCDYIANILREEDSKGSIKLLSLQRLGLMDRHPFTEALYDAIQPLLERLLEDEQARRQREADQDRRQALQRALSELVPDLNKLMASLLETVEDIPGGRNGDTPEPPPPPPPHPPYEPPTAIVFHPDEIGVRAHAEKSTTLYVRDAAFTDGARIRVRTEGKGVKILTRELSIDHARGIARQKGKPDGYSCLPFRVEGTKAGTNALVTASVGDQTAMLLVTVGAQTEPRPRPQPPSGGGFLKGIKLHTTKDKWRAMYVEADRILYINIAHPLLRDRERSGRRRSRGDGGSRYPWSWLAVVADSVCDALFRQVISEYIEVHGRIPRNEGWDKTMVELDNLWFSYASNIHKLVEGRLLNLATED